MKPLSRARAKEIPADKLVVVRWDELRCAFPQIYLHSPQIAKLGAAIERLRGEFKPDD
jgi:hypothetical protein